MAPTTTAAAAELVMDGGESGVRHEQESRLLPLPTLLASSPQAWHDMRVDKPSASPPPTPCSFAHIVQLGEKHEAMHTEDFPESIYGAGMSFFVQSGYTQNHRVHGLSFFIILAMVGNIALQGCTIMSVKAFITVPAVHRARGLYAAYHHATIVNGTFSQRAFDAWDDAHKDRLCQIPLSQPKFSFIILLIWTMSLVIELKETVHFVVWWLQLPRCETQHVKMLKPDDDGECGVVVTSTSIRMKALVVGIILIPKLVIALTLWLMGARWLIATTDFENLVLNAVALTFILELDEVIYAAFLPHSAKKTLAHFKLSTKVGKHEGETNHLLMKWMGHMAFVFTLTAATPILYMRYFQDVLPGYLFDVHEPCKAYLLKKGL